MMWRVARSIGPLAGKRALRAASDQSGQAMVEAAIVMPLMVFLVLGVIQLVMIQHARIMTEYAAFNAARAGIVWNADRIIMENAAIVSLLPTTEGLFEESDLGNPKQMLKRILQRALLYQVNRRLPQAIDLLKNGARQVIDKLPLPDGVQDKLGEGADGLLDQAERVADEALQEAIGSALGGGDDRLVEVTILNPSQGLIPGVTIGGSFSQKEREIDFDDPGNRERTRLTIEVRYLYLMRIPFADWVIHNAWLSAQAGKLLYGAIWNPQENVPGETGFRDMTPLTANSFSDPTLRKVSALAGQGVYMIPLRASYSMRMQSNPYKQSLQVK